MHGWPHLGETLVEAVNKVVSAGRRTLIITTYHYSKGDEHRGCAGFNYDTASARAHTFEIKQEVEAIFGVGHGTVYPLVCGFETDEDAIVVHGSNGDLLNMAELTDADREGLPQRLAALLPDMPNLALIIGPCSPDLADPIHQAAGIIESNMRAGRIPNDGFLLLASAPYDEIGVDKARAMLKARFMSDFAAGVIRKEYPDLTKKMTVRSTVLSWQSRTLDAI